MKMFIPSTYRCGMPVLLNTEFQSIFLDTASAESYISSNLRILAFQILLLLLKSMGIYSVNKGQETRSSWRVSQKAVILCLPCYGSVMDCHSTKDPCWIKSMPVRPLRLAVRTLQEQPSGEVSAMMKRPNVLLDSLSASSSAEEVDIFLDMW